VRTVTGDVVTVGTFVHLVLLDQNADDYLAHVAPFSWDALDQGQPAFVALPPPQIREFADGHPGQHVRYVGEPIWHTRSAPKLREATRHEALINLAFAAAGADILCPYDTTQLEPAVIADAQRTHQVLWRVDTTQPSQAYTGPDSLPPSCQVPLTPPADALPEDGTSLTYTTELATLRALVEKRARAANLPEMKIIDLVLAVSEVAANTLRHAGSHGTLDVWHDDNEIVCTIHDKGTITDPLAGRRRPFPDATAGHGLWLVNEVCDLVEMRSDDSGTTIRMHMAVPPY
jgi:anti-sigma regulatory factor (Ser/Thr protein kinase)